MMPTPLLPNDDANVADNNAVMITASNGRLGAQFGIGRGGAAHDLDGSIGIFSLVAFSEAWLGGPQSPKWMEKPELLLMDYFL